MVFYHKNQELGSIEYGKRSLVGQSMLINTSKIYAAAGGVNGHWTNYANLRGDHKKMVTLDIIKTRCSGSSPIFIAIIMNSN